MALKDLLIRVQDAAERAPEAMKVARRPIKALLIQPPTIGGVRSLLPQSDGGDEGIGFKPPLGLLYIASTLKAHSRHEVKVIDAVAQQLNFEDVVRQAVEFAPDVVGISAWTDFWYPASHLGRLIKAALPHTHLCFGGPHVSIYPNETLAQSFADSVIVGDGEVPFLFLCNLVANEVVDNSMPGLHFKGCGVKESPDTFHIEGDLDDLPIPDRTLLPLRLYSSVLSTDDYVTTMITSRGCPHRCTFCKLNFQKTLARSAASVIEEFKQIHALGIREVEIYDDTFTWSKKRLREICQGLIESDLGLTWAVRDRVNKVDPELLELMYRAGCRRIHLGIESGVDRVIERMKKQITTDQARFAVRAAKDAGMTVLTYFMFGNLDETAEDMNRTVDFALELAADYAEFSITIPYAGTEMYEEALTSGIIDHDYWGQFARNPSPDFMPPQLVENHVRLADMLAIRNRAIKSFYFRPRYILRELLKLKGFGEFLRKAKMGVRLAHSTYSR